MQRRHRLDRLLRIVYYSVWSYLLLAIVAIPEGWDRTFAERLFNRYEADPAQLVWRGVLLVLLPSLVIATTSRLWSGSRLQRRVLRILRINERHEEPTGWDYFLRQRPSCYVRVTMKSGGRVLGYYGSRSFAAYAKDGRDLYLEQLWLEDDEGWFACESNYQHGVWINTEDSVSVEFYALHDEPKAQSIPAAPARVGAENRRSPTP